jgi:DNA-binding IclR family transcriptional regulator
MIQASAGEIAARYPDFSPALLRDLATQTRARGFALNPGLLMAGSWGVGVPILDRQGRCEGALSIAAIESRLGPNRQHELGALLKAEAERLAERLAKPAGASDLTPPAPRRRSAAAGALHNRR